MSNPFYYSPERRKRVVLHLRVFMSTGHLTYALKGILREITHH